MIKLYFVSVVSPNIFPSNKEPPWPREPKTAHRVEIVSEEGDILGLGLRDAESAAKKSVYLNAASSRGHFPERRCREGAIGVGAPGAGGASVLEPQLGCGTHLPLTGMQVPGRLRCWAAMPACWLMGMQVPGRLRCWGYDACPPLTGVQVPGRLRCWAAVPTLPSRGCRFQGGCSSGHDSLQCLDLPVGPSASSLQLSADCPRATELFAADLVARDSGASLFPSSTIRCCAHFPPVHGTASQRTWDTGGRWFTYAYHPGTRSQGH